MSKYVTYNLFGGLDILSIVKEITEITYFDIEYKTEVTIGDILSFKEFEILAKHKLNESGYITAIENVSLGHYQIFTNIDVKTMCDMLEKGTLKYSIESVKIVGEDLLDEEKELINYIETYYDAN